MMMNLPDPYFRIVASNISVDQAKTPCQTSLEVVFELLR
jgi:hypothetical protein